jgi:hypothetical protein
MRKKRPQVWKKRLQAIAEEILALPADLSPLERDKRVIALCKGLDEDERIGVAEQGNRLKRWEEAAYLATFNPAEQYVGALPRLELHFDFDPFGQKERKHLRRARRVRQ